MDQIEKYPRTPHLEGSKLQPGDDTAGQMSLAELRDLYPDATFIIEEKLDGANCGFSLDEGLDLRIQSRGHVLSGGARERQFAQLKEWSTFREAEISDLLEDRYVLYGEWTFAKHTQFYDALPHFLHEFDILDRETGQFLSTPRRHELLSGGPFLSVPVLSTEWSKDAKALRAMLGPSLYRTPGWRESLAAAAEAEGVDPAQALRDSGADRPDADLAEGFYIKIEDEEHVLARFKWVRQGFLQTILDSGTHWSARPMIRNRLAHGVDLFARPARVSMEVVR